ncbi:MAG: ABC transporter ATP-binding protein [Candidatus Rokubacteria bacterium]|nr:ABC transporter ATP-binding protein [Candidatus Rokubacteria bacterium]
MSPYLSRYVVGIACLGAATAFSLAIPWTVKDAIEALQADPAGAALTGYALTILALAAANGLARLGSRFAIVGAAQRVEADIRTAFYASLETFPPRLFAAYRTGDLMARGSSDVAATRTLVGFGALSLVATSFAFVGALAAMVAIDPWLALASVTPYPVMVVLAQRFTRAVHEGTEAVQGQLGVLSGRVQEYVSGMAVVRAYTMEARARADFAAANAEYLRRSLALTRLQARFTPLLGLIAGVGTLIVLWIGGGAVVEGRLSLGALVAFNGYLAYLAWPTMALGWTLSMIRSGLTSMGRIQEIVEAQVVPGGDGAAPDGPPSIRFAGLTFAYDGGRAVLEDVDFEVVAGETVAVVGRTGSGKSTLGLLLARLQEPPPGTVFLSGRDVTGMRLDALRRALGHVPQEGFLFSRSIEENVTLGREGVEADRARAAADAAGIADEIARFPRGWDTVVGERGLTLSGGQRQRVALARALAGDPSVLVLDDVFASVDAAKEEAIVANLRRSPEGRTVLLMTHRLRAAQTADRVVVLERGRVVEQGTHDALLRAGGTYARLWRIQQLEEEIAGA